MKDVILLGIGFVSGILATIAFLAKAKSVISGALQKALSKVGNKS